MTAPGRKEIVAAHPRCGEGAVNWQPAWLTYCSKHERSAAKLVLSVYEVPWQPNSQQLLKALGMGHRVVQRRTLVVVEGLPEPGLREKSGCLDLTFVNCVVKRSGEDGG